MGLMVSGVEELLHIQNDPSSQGFRCLRTAQVLVYENEASLYNLIVTMQSRSTLAIITQGALPPLSR
jgi:hypothetical protein